MPDLTTLTPVATGTNPFRTSPCANATIILRCSLPASSKYPPMACIPSPPSLTMAAKCGSEINWWSITMASTARPRVDGHILLNPGKHAFTLAYNQGGGGFSLEVRYAGPNLPQQPIPATAYWRDAPAAAVAK